MKKITISKRAVPHYSSMLLAFIMLLLTIMLFTSCATHIYHPCYYISSELEVRQYEVQQWQLANQQCAQIQELSELYYEINDNLDNGYLKDNLYQLDTVYFRLLDLVE